MTMTRGVWRGEVPATYPDCELCGSAVIDNKHKCLESVMMRHREKLAQERIDALVSKVIHLERAIRVTDGRRLVLRLEDIETDIRRLCARVRDLEEE